MATQSKDELIGELDRVARERSRISMDREGEPTRSSIDGRRGT